MIIRVVGRRPNVDFITKEGVHIQGTSYFYIGERRGVEGYARTGFGIQNPLP